MARFKSTGRTKGDQRVGARRWIVAFVIIALVIVAGKAYTWGTGRPNPVDSVIRTLATPVVYVIKMIGDGTVYTFKVIGSFPTLLRQKNELETENALLERRNEELQQLAAENTQLRELLHLRIPAGYVGVPASVIARPYDLWLESAVINVGTSSGVQQGNLVVNEKGVVGKITETFEAHSRVQLLVSPQFRLGAISGADGDRQRSEGVIRGIDRETLSFDYLPAGSQIQVGDKVFTRGAETFPGGGENRPRGVLIGVVTRRVTDRNGFLTVSVRPAADPSSVGTVVVMTR
jgi:rod shape-determining protein MreC